MDAAALLPTAPSLSASDQSALEDVWLKASGNGNGNRVTAKSGVKGIRDAISTAFSDAMPPTLGTALVAVLTTGVAVCWAMGTFARAEESTKAGGGSGHDSAGAGGGDNSSAGGPGKKRKTPGKGDKAYCVRGGGGGGAVRGVDEGGVHGEGSDSCRDSDAFDRPAARERGDSMNYVSRDSGSSDVDPAIARRAPPPSPLSGRTRNGKGKGKKSADVGTRTAAVPGTGTSNRRGRRKEES